MRKFQLTAAVAAMFCWLLAPLPAASSVSVADTGTTFLSLPENPAGDPNELFGIYKTYSDNSCGTFYAHIFGVVSLTNAIGLGHVNSYEKWPFGTCYPVP